MYRVNCTLDCTSVAVHTGCFFAKVMTKFHYCDLICHLVCNLVYDQLRPGLGLRRFSGQNVVSDLVCNFLLKISSQTRSQNRSQQWNLGITQYKDCMTLCRSSVCIVLRLVDVVTAEHCYLTCAFTCIRF